MFRLLMIWAFVLLFNSLPAQQLVFKNYSMQDGLVANSVRCIFQDAKGFIWIGTWQGLCKYDGNKFTSFTTANGLSFDFINDLRETAPGTLYVALNNGCIDKIEYDQVTRNVVDQPLIVNSFFRADSSSLYAVTDNEGLFMFKNGQFSRLSASIRGSLTAYCPLNDSMMVIGGDDNLFYITDKQLSIIAKSREWPKHVFRLYCDRRQRVWACTGKGLMLIDPRQNRNGFMRFLPLPSHLIIPALSGVISDMIEDEEGNFWLGTVKGLVKINHNGKVQIFTAKDGLLSNIIRCIFIDREKNIWIGTDHGVSKIVSKNNIQLFSTSDGLADNDIMDLYTDTSSGIYLITASGILQQMDVGNYSLTTKNVKRSTGPVVFMKPQPQSFNREGYSLTLLTVDPIHRTASPTTVSPGRFYYFAAKDSTGNFFFGTDSGVYWHNPYRHIGCFTGSVRTRVTAMAFDHQGRLWMGTWNQGLCRLKISYRNGKPESFTENLSHLIPDTLIRSLFVDKTGNLWIGTRYNGVVRLTSDANGQFRLLHFSRKQGLISNFVTRIAESDNGTIWIATHMGGLNKLVPSGDTFRVFNFSRVNNFFETIYDLYPSTGTIVRCTTPSGLVQFRDDQVENAASPEVYITRLQAGKGANTILVTDMRQQITLPYYQNLIQFEFSAPSYINEKEILYSHRLLGSPDTTWSTPANQHTVFYASLLPGKYIFEVKALGWNSGWSHPTTYRFTIYPPFWRTWWFMVGTFTAIASMIIFWLRKRIQHIRHVAEMKQKIAETEMMALRAQMNPHFIFNCINSIDALIQSNDKFHATVYLNKFAKLLRNVLDSSKQTTVTLAKDLETLQLYIDLEQLRDENKFTASIKADNSLIQGDYKVPPLIVQPYVENAIIHGLKNRPDNKGQLIITVSKQQEYIEYLIEDNGVGRSAPKNSKHHGTSYGMQMSRDRVQFFNNEEHASVVVIDLEQHGLPAGTKIQVLLKIQ